MLSLLRHPRPSPAAARGEAGLPAPIAGFVAARHVLTLAVADAAGVWAASCFYAVDVGAADLVVLASAATRHGRAMLDRPQVAGGIAGQPTRLSDIEGVQFDAVAERLDGVAGMRARAFYTARHPMAGLAAADVWRLRLVLVKHTSNRLAFARKTLWRRPDAPADDLAPA